MSNGSASSDSRDSSSMAFVAGLFAGAVIGAGLGLLFAPRSGYELRGRIAGKAADVGKAVSETIDGVTEAGRDMYAQARDVVSSAGEGIDRLASEASKGMEKGMAAARAIAPGRSRRVDGTPAA